VSVLVNGITQSIHETICSRLDKIKFLNYLEKVRQMTSISHSENSLDKFNQPLTTLQATTIKRSRPTYANKLSRCSSLNSDLKVSKKQKTNDGPKEKQEADESISSQVNASVVQNNFNSQISLMPQRAFNNQDDDEDDDDIIRIDLREFEMSL